jgi:hypothetical protein
MMVGLFFVCPGCGFGRFSPAVYVLTIGPIGLFVKEDLVAAVQTPVGSTQVIYIQLFRNHVRLAEHRVFSQTLETHMHFPYAPVSRSTSSTSHQRNASGEKGFADVFCGLPQ